MAIRTYCDECDKVFFEESTFQLGTHLPVGWALIQVGLARRATPQMEPGPTAVVGEIVDEDGRRFGMRMMGQQGQPVPPVPAPTEPEAVTATPLWICPRCAETRIAGLEFTAP